MTTSQTFAPATSEQTHENLAKPVTSSRGWAAAGLGTGLAGIATFVFSSMVDSIYVAKPGDTAAQIMADMATHKGALIGMHASVMVYVLLAVVFGAGLSRRLRIQAPAGSLLPSIAAAGMGLVSVAGLIGSGLDTEYISILGHPENYGPDGVFYGHWIGTMPWLWAGAGIAAIALAIAALRHSAAPRWIGWVSVVLRGLTLISAVSPLQYLSLATGALWAVIVSIGFIAGGRRQA